MNENDYQDYHTTVLEHIRLLKNNKNPLNAKGDPLMFLYYSIDDSTVLHSLFDVLIENCSYKGSIQVGSTNFDDTIGYKIAKIIEKNNLSCLIIENREKPFSDRVTKLIGDALEFNTSLITLEVYMKVEQLSPTHLCKFLQNPQSNLENLYNLKLDKTLFESLSLYITKRSKLKNIGFYYEPLKFIDLMYEPEIDTVTYHKFADKIQNDSHITSVEIIPLFDNFDREINDKLYKYIYELSETLKFSCNINRKEHSALMNIEATYEDENNKMKNIIENLNLSDIKNKKNSIISIRSYLKRTIGELLNNALYELEIQRERNPDKDEFFTAKGSIKFVAGFLIENKK